MALTVEDGSGVPGANSYCSVADCAAYFTARGLLGDASFTSAGMTAWTGSDTGKETVLLKACQYIERAYYGRWKGFRVHELQGLAWPRSSNKPLMYTDVPLDAVPTASILRDIDGWLILPNVVPQVVKDAQCEAALLSLQGVALTTTVSPTLKAASQTLDRASWSETYGAAVSQRDARLQAIDDMLIALLINKPGATFGNVPLMRG